MDPEAHLCHYTGAETAFAHILPSGKLRMNAYRKMRDPFENKEPKLRAGTGWGEDERDEFVGRFFEVEQEVGKARDRYCLLSLTRGERDPDRPSEVRFCCPWARPRMWEQYAEAHAGVCLVFDRPRLIAAVEEALRDKGQLWHQAVNYTRAGFAGSHAAVMSLDPQGQTIAEYVRDHVLRNHEEFFFLKTSDWSSEFEYRFVSRRNDDDHLLLKALPPIHYVPYSDALRFVILGERFPDWLLPSAELAAARRGAEIRRMDWERGPYPKRIQAQVAEPPPA